MNQLKIGLKFLLVYSPECVKVIIRKFAKYAEIRKAKQRQRRTKVSKKYVHDIIGKLCLDCDVMLHTSIINIGEIEGGAKFLAEEILDRINIAKHTLLVPALPFRGSFADYLKKGDVVFDVRTAPIAMGSLSKYIASLPQAKRSIHPTHSVVAIGKDAEYYTNEHHLDNTPFGIHSPYYKLIRNRGKVILWGATLNNLTCICAVEDMLGNCYKDYVYSPQKYKVKCIDKDGNFFYVQTCCHDPKKAIKRNLLFIHDALVNEGIMEVYPIGEAEIAVIDIKEFAVYYLQLLAKGYSNRGKIRVTEELQYKIEQVISGLL